jgi:hypothetical protein
MNSYEYDEERNVGPDAVFGGLDAFYPAEWEASS